MTETKFLDEAGLETLVGEVQDRIGRGMTADGDGALALGDNAAASGNYATALGDNANASGASAAALGYLANASGANATALGRGAAASGDWAAALGYATDASGDCAAALGHAASASGDYAAALGRGADASAANATALGRGATCATADGIQLGSSSLSSLSSAVSLTVTSDGRDKTDVETMECDALEFVRALRPVTYVRNPRALYVPEELSEDDAADLAAYGLCAYDEEAHEAGTLKGERVRAGFIAQEVEDAMGCTLEGGADYAAVVNDSFHDLGEDAPEDVESQLSMDYTALVPFLVRAVQQLADEADETRERIGSAGDDGE